MPKLILKSPYIKCGGKGGIGGGGYLRYIGTRDGVELVPDDRPATKRQEQLIRSLVRDFPDSRELLEYADWEASRTKAHASAFITTALECNWEQANRSDVYLKYIATRPRVERLGSHGLFGDDDSVDLQKAAVELDSYTGNVWTHIISLKREDAARLGYDRASAWRDLLRQERNEIAAAMSIPPDHFRWYAAFHDEGDHPHVHMMAWSSQPKEGWLDRDGICKIKSTLLLLDREDHGLGGMGGEEGIAVFQHVLQHEPVRPGRGAGSALAKTMVQAEPVPVDGKADIKIAETVLKLLANAPGLAL